MAFCEHCGAALSEGARFCEACGAPCEAPTDQVGMPPVRQSPVTQQQPRVPSSPVQPVAQPAVVQPTIAQPAARSTATRPPTGSSIAVDENGTYRWVFEYNMFRDPTVFFTLLKVFGGVAIGLLIVISIFDIIEGNWDIIDLGERLRFDAIILAVMCGLALVGYLIYALIQGGSFCVMFTMDEEGVENRPMPKEMKKAEAIATLNVLMGLATGNATQVGIGLTSAAGNITTSTFSNVRSIQGYPRRGVIKVNEPFAKNQVYVEKADYDWVYAYIRDRCPQAKER